MGIIKASKLIFDYIRHDEEEKAVEVDRAIDGLSLDIAKGSFVAILGHNGSGKSTFAKQINGILTPTDGTVWVSGMKSLWLVSAVTRKHRGELSGRRQSWQPGTILLLSPCMFRHRKRAWIELVWRDSVIC